MLHLDTSGTTQRIRAITLVQAATLGEGVRDFLFDAFLHVARHDRPRLATADSESPPPTGDRVWVPPIDRGRHLVGHSVVEWVDTQGRTRYREPHMAHPPPSATPSDTKEWEQETWEARMAFLSNFRHHVPGDVPTPDDQQPAPSTYMTLMYNLHYTLSTTHYHAPTGHLVVHGTDSLLPADYAPPANNQGLDTYTREDEPDDPHLWGTWERKSLDTLLTIRSGNQGLGRAMHCLAKWTQRTWGVLADRWLWNLTLRPQQREAPPNRRGTTPPRPTSLQLCPYMVAARLVTMLWPGPHTPTGNYRHLTEEDMPGIQRYFVRTLDYLQKTDIRVLEQIWTPPGNPRTRTAETTPPHRDMHPHRHQHAQVTRESARTRPVPEPAPSFSLLAGPSILRPPLQPRAHCCPPRPSSPLPTPQPPPPQRSHPPPPPRPHPTLHPPKPRGKPPKRASKPVPTASNPAAAKAQATMRPPPAAHPKPKTATKQPPEPVGAPPLQPAAKPKPKPKPGAITVARA